MESLYGKNMFFFSKNMRNKISEQQEGTFGKFEPPRNEIGFESVENVLIIELL